MLALFSMLPAPAAPVPADALVHADDFTFGYYPYGWRRDEQDPVIRYAVQTNRYAMLVDASNGRVTRLGPVPPSEKPLHAAVQGNELLNRLPNAEIDLAVVWNGHAFPMVSGAGTPDQMRLQHVGKYLQQFQFPVTQIGGQASGAGLEGASAWIDGYCWPDRLSLEAKFDWREIPALPSSERKDVNFAAMVKVPDTYPIVETLGADDAWQPAAEKSDRAILMRNERGEGIALLCIPGVGQRARRGEDGRLLVESAPFTFRAPAQQTFACVVVPSLDVRAAALHEVRQMAASTGGVLQVSAEGMAPYTGPLEGSYDPVKGWWQILLGDNNDINTMERVRVAVDNTGTAPATVRLNFAKAGGSFPVTGMSPVLRDTEGWPLGLPVQVSKNWHTTPCWFHGLTMLDAAPNAPLDFEFDLAYGFWGGVPAVSHAQLCLVGYGGNQLWDEMAIGSFGESITYDPDVNLTRSMVDDIRPLMVWGMGKTPKTQWSWTHNVGGCDFLTLFLKDQPKRQYLRRQKTLYSSYGPVTSDVTYAGETPDGAIQSRVRTQTWRVDDYVRALYTLRYRVTKPVGDIDRLAFFQLGADRYNDISFRRMARGTIKGLDEIWEPEKGGRSYSRRGETLVGDFPWVGMYEVNKDTPRPFPEGDQGALGDKAFIVRAWKAQLGGRDCPVPCYSVYGAEDGWKGALVELSPPKDMDRLEEGDFVEAQIEFLVLPQRADDYYGPNQNMVAALKANAEPWALTLREAVGANVSVEATIGQVEQTWPVRITADKGEQAEFTVTGGVGYTPVTICGAKANHCFSLYTKSDDGTLTKVDQSSAVGHDWWQADFDAATQTWDITYTLPLDTPGDARTAHRFAWRINGEAKQ
jgi:hypothetical protein